SIVVLEVRGFAAASSAALVVVLGRSTLEARIKNEYPSNSTPLQTKTLQICYILHKVKNSFEGVKSLRRDRPGTIIAAKNTSQRGMLQERCRNVTSATLNIAGNVAATFLQRSYVRLSATFRMLQERCTEHCRNVAGTLQECCRKVAG
ncbi:hypothetical protein PV325_012599, partial [Microctonus aethiopoides]